MRLTLHHRSLKAVSLGIALFMSLGMLILQSNASWACRLLTIVSVKPVPELAHQHLIENSRSLMHQASGAEPYYQMAGQSLSVNMMGPVVPTIDGVGLVGFNAQHQVLRSMYYRNAENLELPKAQVAFTTATQALAPSASVVMANLRAKTQGAVDASNNHPFLVSLKRDTPESTWAFMGNGGTKISTLEYQAWVKDERIKVSPQRMEVMTDTEMLFHVLLQDALPLLEKPIETPDALAQAISRKYANIQGRITPGVYGPFSEQKGYATLAKNNAFHSESTFLRYWPKTWVLSNGRFTFFMVHGYDQWLKIHYNTKGQPESMVFASEPTDIQEFYLQQQAIVPDDGGASRWQQLPQDSLAVAYVTSENQVQVKLYPVVIRQSSYPAEIPTPASKQGTPTVPLPATGTVGH